MRGSDSRCPQLAPSVQVGRLSGGHQSLTQHPDYTQMPLAPKEDERKRDSAHWLALIVRAYSRDLCSSFRLQGFSVLRDQISTIMNQRANKAFPAPQR
jgi:hypothetical protein